MIDEHAKAATIYQSIYIYIFHVQFTLIIYIYQVEIEMTRIEFINYHRFIMNDNYFLKSAVSKIFFVDLYIILERSKNIIMHFNAVIHK